MPFVTANQIKFHVQRMGKGPPLVMAHGLLLGSLASWYFTAAAELAKTHEVVLYDLRGHGRSERTKSGYDIKTMSRDLEQLTSEFEKMTLVGHSYGALVALRFALDNPERVSRLAIVEAPLPPSQFGEIEEFVSRSPQAMVDGLPEQMREFLASGNRRAKRLLESLRFLTQECTLLDDLRAESDIPDETLAELRCPVLCVYGKNSSCLSTGERLKRVLNDVRLVVLDGGHYLHLDAPARVSAELARFANG